MIQNLEIRLETQWEIRIFLLKIHYLLLTQGNKHTNAYGNIAYDCKTLENHLTIHGNS